MRLPIFQPTIRHLEEPCIEVGEGIAVPEPKMGWTLLGPLGDRSANYLINVGLIGDSKSLEKMKNLIERLNVTTYGKDKTFLHVDFPGVEKLRIKLNVRWVSEIEEKEIKQLDDAGSFSERVGKAANIIREKIKALTDKDPTPDVLFLAYPKKIDEYCIEGAVGQRKMPRKTSFEKYIEKMRSKHVTLDRFFNTPLPTKPHTPHDLRSLIKAACMDCKIPIQILRPNTTEPYNSEQPKREDDATTFWNLIVAIFYKSNHIPWRVKNLMKDTCYIGISFFRDKGNISNVKTALAQVFSLDSEGFVFKGGEASMDENRTLHISKEKAARLIQQAIEVYKRNNDEQSPRRVVVHKTSRFNDDEKAGFINGVEGTHKVDLVAFGTRNIKLMRWGQQPPIRGTMVRLPDDSILLYTFGYIPYLDVYPGPRVPSPLEILEYHGQTSIDTICTETLALTKLNWNNAKFCSKAPITIAFARRVGDILRECPDNITPADKFRYYM